MANIGIIGIGPHSKRIYLPFIQQLEQQGRASLKLVVDLTEKKQEIESLLANHACHKLFVDKFSGTLPKNIDQLLSEKIRENQIDAIIIATEPTVHYQYSLWALRNDLNILLDKPITSNDNVVNDMALALGLYEDFEKIKNEYKNKPNLFFGVNTQRRYHAGFSFVSNALEEVKKQVGIPITYINSTHADGQWRLPNEIVTQDYHPYNSGYGKASHSGYHLFDLVAKLIQDTNYPSHKPDGFKLYSNALFPNGFLKQMPLENYTKYFGEQFDKNNPFSEEELKNLYQTFGEMDCFSNIAFEKDGDTILNVMINLLHNSFAMRDRATPGKDLYKGNGRVKHETHTINQGPFQSIQIHSYQSNDKHEKNSEMDYERGGNNHFEVSIFRNSRMLGGSSFQSYNIKDIMHSNNPESLLIEEIKKGPVLELIDYVNGGGSHGKSNLLTHELGVKIMSTIYQSLANQRSGGNPVIISKI